MVNGMVGRVVDILYAAGTAPPAPPVGVVAGGAGMNMVRSSFGSCGMIARALFRLGLAMGLAA